MSFCYPDKSQKPNHLTTAQTLKQLQILALGDNTKLIDSLESNLEPPEGLEQNNYALIRFSEQLFSNYGQSHKLASEIKAALNKLLPIVAAIQITEPQWVWQPHPFIELLSTIQNHCVGWQAENKATQRFLTQLNGAIDQCVASWQQDDFDYADNPITLLFDREDKRIAKLEQRVKEAESGALKARRSQEMSTRIINDKMRDKILPASISQILQTSWHDSINLLLINSSNFQADYHRLNKLTETFIWTLQPFAHDDNDTQQRIYRLIGTLQEEFASNLASLKHQPDKLEETLATIEHEHLSILKGQALTPAPFTLLETESPLNTSQTKISGTLLKKLNHIQEGHWFSHQVDGNNQAIKLILKLSDSQQLLFSNHAGMKACQYSFEELAYKLSNSSIKALPYTCRIKQTATILVENLFKVREHQQEKVASKLAEKQQQLEALTKKRQLDKQKALDEASALETQQQQSRQVEQEPQKQATEKTTAKTVEQTIKSSVEQPKLSFEDQQQYSTMLHKLCTGGLVRFHRSGQSRDCKLAAVTQQGQTFIFINKQGIKDSEVVKQDLIVQLAMVQAEIIDYGDNFEDALSKVVNSIRNKK